MQDNTAIYSSSGRRSPPWPPAALRAELIGPPTRGQRAISQPHRGSSVWGCAGWRAELPGAAQGAVCRARAGPLCHVRAHSGPLACASSRSARRFASQRDRRFGHFDTYKCGFEAINTLGQVSCWAPRLHMVPGSVRGQLRIARPRSAHSHSRQKHLYPPTKGLVPTRKTQKTRLRGPPSKLCKFSVGTKLLRGGYNGQPRRTDGSAHEGEGRQPLWRKPAATQGFAVCDADDGSQVGSSKCSELDQRRLREGC